MNLGQFRTRVSSEIGLSNTNGSSEQTLIDGWVNDAIVQFLLETKCYVQPYSVALTGGSDSYTIQSDVLSLTELYITASDGTISPMLEPMSPDEIVARKRFPASGWSPLGYALMGANLLLFSSAANTGDTLKGYYVPKPTAMTTATDDPSSTSPTNFGGIPTEFHETLLQYPLWKAATWDDDMSSLGQGRRGILALGQQYQQEWEQGIAKAKLRLRRKAGVRLAPAKPGGRSRRTYTPTSPGVDTGQ